MPSYCTCAHVKNVPALVLVVENISMDGSSLLFQRYGLPGYLNSRVFLFVFEFKQLDSYFWKDVTCIKYTADWTIAFCEKSLNQSYWSLWCSPFFSVVAPQLPQCRRIWTAGISDHLQSSLEQQKELCWNRCKYDLQQFCRQRWGRTWKNCGMSSVGRHFHPLEGAITEDWTPVHYVATAGVRTIRPGQEEATIAATDPGGLHLGCIWKILFKIRFYNILHLKKEEVKSVYIVKPWEFFMGFKSSFMHF